METKIVEVLHLAQQMIRSSFLMRKFPSFRKLQIGTNKRISQYLERS